MMHMSWPVAAALAGQACSVCLGPHRAEFWFPVRHQARFQDNVSPTWVQFDLGCSFPLPPRHRHSLVAAWEKAPTLVTVFPASFFDTVMCAPVRPGSNAGPLFLCAGFVHEAPSPRKATPVSPSVLADTARPLSLTRSRTVARQLALPSGAPVFSHSRAQATNRVASGSLTAHRSPNRTLLLK